MKDQKTKTRFIELRAQGWSLQRIATELLVAKRSLVTWNRQFRLQIDELHGFEMEALQEQFLSSRADRVRRTAEQLRLVAEEKSKRNLADLSTTRLFLLEECLRRQIIRDTTPTTLGAAETDSAESILDHEEAIIEEERVSAARKSEEADLARYYGVPLEDHAAPSVQTPDQQPVSGRAAPVTGPSGEIDKK